jgi:putative membrane protein
MRNLKQCLFVSTLVLLLASCGNKPKNPETPNVGSDTTTGTTSDNTNSNMTDDGTNPDEDFVMEAGEGGLFEVMAGELAVKKGSAKVRKLGQMMVDDHGKANADLKKIASDKQISLPTSLGNDLQQKYDKLMKKEGKDFDMVYTDMMVSDHKKDIEKFRKESKDGKDADFKKFASDKLPTLEHHLHMSEETQKNNSR